MSKVDGSASIEIEAPIATVFGADGSQVLVHMETDAKVRTLGSEMRFSYEAPERISWTQEEGDLKAIDGTWELEDLGNGRTRATYRLEVDLGRKLGLLIRGPLVGVLRMTTGTAHTVSTGPIAGHAEPPAVG